jgi:hypothetical protein
MPAANWKARRRAAAADARRQLPVIPQPADDGEDDPWAAFMLAFVLTLLAFTAVMAVYALSSGRP